MRKNSVWFLILAVIHIILFVYTIWKKKDRKFVVLFFYLSGLAYIFEFVILVLLKSYVYNPKILKRDYFDNIFGAMISQLIVVPVTAIFITAFHLKKKWMACFTAFYVVIECLFIKINVYRHVWWHLLYTAIGIPILYLISKQWYKLIQRSSRKIIRIPTLYFSLMTVFSTINFLIISLTEVYFYRPGWFKEKGRDHVTFAMLFSIIVAAVITILTSMKNKIIRIIGILFLHAIQRYLVAINILRPKKFSLIYLCIAVYAFVLMIGDWFNRILIGGVQPKKEATES